jgi:hypothetical protein
MQFAPRIRDLAPALATLAHEGTKVYTEAIDWIYRHEATDPNAVWQADHKELDVYLKDGHGQPEKPLLIVILDDDRRAVASFALSFSRPVGNPDGPGDVTDDLAQGQAGLASLRHPRNGHELGLARRGRASSAWGTEAASVRREAESRCGSGPAGTA